MFCLALGVERFERRFAPLRAGVGVRVQSGEGEPTFLVSEVGPQKQSNGLPAQGAVSERCHAPFMRERMAARGKDTTMKTTMVADRDRAQARAQALAQVLVAVLALVLVPVLMLAIWVSGAGGMVLQRLAFDLEKQAA
jgi:hypothetical protein